MTSDAVAPLEPGTILAGKFRIERVLGQGAMGVVVQAHHLKLDEEVAIKFLLPEALSNPEAVRRFEREARAAAKIKSEHIVRVSDVGSLESGAPYMVMEYLHGTDIGALLKKSGPMSLELAADYLLQASEAVAEAHALGIVHRDLKPANLFLSHRFDGSACVKVLDFGISKVTNRRNTDEDADMTSTAAVMGSPLYMSPEQLTSSRQVDARTDIWALGVILYELLTDRCPFAAESLPQLCMKVITDPPEPLRSYRKDLPQAVQDLISACLEKDRERRVPTISEFVRRLSECAPGQSQISVGRVARVAQVAARTSTSAVVAPSSAPVSVKTGGGTLTEFGKTGNRRAQSSRRLVWLATGAGVLALLGVGGILSMGGSPEPAPAPSVIAAARPIEASKPAPEPTKAETHAPVVTPVPDPPVVAPAVPKPGPVPGKVAVATKPPVAVQKPKVAPRVVVQKKPAAAAVPSAKATTRVGLGGRL